MNDREQLEMAAKAAGYQIDQRASLSTWRHSSRLALLNPQGGHTLWNANEDDGDALRLVVRLKQLGLWNKPYTGEALDGWREDPYAATRRAIVRVAVEIGKAMP